MKNKPFTVLVISGLILFAFLAILVNLNSVINVNGQNIDPVLFEAEVYFYDDSEEGPMAEFGVTYQDLNGDSGTVLLYVDVEDPVTMNTLDQDPVEGQYHVYYILQSQIDDYTEFRFSANDTNGSVIFFPLEDDDPFLVGDYEGWGEPPVLSNPDVYLDDDWVFNVTYRDIDGDNATEVYLILEDYPDNNYILMETSDDDPESGQNYIASVLEDDVNDSTEFYFITEDTGGSYTELYDENDYPFEVGDFDTSNGGNENGDGGNGGGTPIGKGWLDEPEVVVGLIGLVAIGAGSAYGVLRRKKKHGRFSELLTQLDEVYGSFKLNPKRCETELEKMRATINEDLKKSTIDENNYTILKTRIDEILGEIRSESIRTEVAELPKDIEIKIKDMLIDGEITREEYDKLLPIIKGSDMATDEKEKMKKMVGSWVKEDKSE